MPLPSPAQRAGLTQALAPMKQITGLTISFIVLGLTGCMNDQTKAMAEVCQQILEQTDQRAPVTFIEDAESRIASLSKPQNKLLTYARDLQDPEAMTYKPLLEQCLSQVKQRQASSSGR